MEALIWETAEELDKIWHCECAKYENAARFPSRSWLI